MNRCLQLAALGAGQVAPNPMVGALLVYKGRVIGEGYHQQYGKAHAEVNCIKSVSPADKELVASSIMYVSLEPCAHFGKTAPCTDLIIEHSIPKVVIGCKDSFEAVNGRGIEALKTVGVAVETGVLEKECIEINKRFFVFHEQQRPYVILKWAQTSDGFIASNTAERIFISTEITNCLVHKWRSEEAGILIGTNTALLDDPALTTRRWTGDSPVRLVIDKELKLPNSLRLFDGSNKTIVFNHVKQEAGENLLYHQINSKAEMLLQILAELHKLNLQSVIVEGGAKLLQSFIDAGLWDEARVISNMEMVIGEGLAAPVLKNETRLIEEKYGTDLISYFKKKTTNT